MPLFGSSSKTQQTVQNQQTGASEGSVAVGAGGSFVANTNIQTLDAQLGETAIREVGGTARAAIDTGAQTAATLTRASLDFAAGEQERNRAREENLLNFARQQGELVAAGAGVTPPAAVGDLSKQLVIVVVAVIAGFIFINRGKTA